VGGVAFPFLLLLTLAIALMSAAGLRAWRQWLELKRAQITRNEEPRGRAELRELRRRVRHLEALASGIEL
jgi:Na+-transporting methylmalonyl-CoA/oxaloacetate decarboxylase gamma subunit